MSNDNSIWQTFLCIRRHSWDWGALRFILFTIYPPHQKQIKKYNEMNRYASLWTKMVFAIIYTICLHVEKRSHTLQSETNLETRRRLLKPFILLNDILCIYLSIIYSKFCQSGNWNRFSFQFISIDDIWKLMFLLFCWYLGYDSYEILIL